MHVSHMTPWVAVRQRRSTQGEVIAEKLEEPTPLQWKNPARIARNSLLNDGRGSRPGMAGAAALPDAAGPAALSGCSTSGGRHSLWQASRTPHTSARMAQLKYKKVESSFACSMIPSQTRGATPKDAMITHGDTSF